MDFNLASVDLPALLSDIVGSQQGHAQTKNLTLTLLENELPPVVFADPVRLRQVLLNLTNNALKFTEQGSVTVRASSEGDRVRIEVQDTGVGIKPEDQQLIFEKFRQSEAFVTRSHQGTGLGLTLAKELVEHMGGEIGMSSTPNVGSTFYVVLPAIDKSQS
jgi:signal transduction histidine kinase